MEDEQMYQTIATVQPYQSLEIGSLIAALSKAQGMMTGAIKDSSNPFFKSKYADLHQVWEAVREPLAKNELAVVQTTQIEGEKMIVVTTLAHASGQYMKSYTPVKTMKDDPQGMGSAITYARRYALAAICGIAQMGDDGESAMNRGQVSGQPINLDKIHKAISFFKNRIENCDEEPQQIEEIQNAYSRLTNDEKMKVEEGLRDKCPDTNKMYRTLLTDYLKMEANNVQAN